MRKNVLVDGFATSDLHHIRDATYFSMPSTAVGSAAPQEIAAELHAVHPIVDPPAACLDELAGTDRRSVADDGDQVALAARLHPQHAEPAVFIVKGDALDEAGEVLAFG